MKKIIEFVKVDFRVTSNITIYALVFIILAYVVSILGNNPFFGIIYILFGALILTTQPFITRTKGNSGFLLMLPGTDWERVAGRFLYGSFLLSLSMVAGMLLFVANGWIHGGMLSWHNLLLLCLFCFSFSLIILGIQYMIMYIVGEMKSNYVISIIRIVPGFLFYIVSGILLNVFEEMFGVSAVQFLTGVSDPSAFVAADGSKQLLFDVICFILEHMVLSAVVFLVISVLITALCAFLSNKIIEKRDYA